MAKATKIFERMEANPGDNWRIDQIISVADAEKLIVRRPSNGSHYTFASQYLQSILTVPHKRPIKALYVKKFVAMVKSHRDAKEEDK